MAESTTDPTTEEIGTPATDPTDVEGTPAGSTATTPQGTPHDAIELPFRLEDVENEEHRAWLQGRQAQMQAGYTKAIQKHQERFAPFQTLADQLAADDDTARLRALAEFAESHGIELDIEDDGDPADDGAGPDPFADPADPLQARIDALEEREQQRQQDQFRDAFNAHAHAGLEALAQQVGADGVSALPEFVRDEVIEIAGRLERRPDGLLNMDDAIVEHLARQAARDEAIRAKYRGSKDVPHVQIGSSEADPSVDLTDQKQRLKAAEAVAARHA